MILGKEFMEIIDVNHGRNRQETSHERKNFQHIHRCYKTEVIHVGANLCFVRIFLTLSGCVWLVLQLLGLLVDCLAKEKTQQQQQIPISSQSTLNCREEGKQRAYREGGFSGGGWPSPACSPVVTAGGCDEEEVWT
jgi:hypothetical protein